MAEMQNVTSNLFEPQIFQEMVNALTPSKGLRLYNSVKKETTVFPYVQWTVKHGRWSELAEFNAPNSKANVIERQPEKMEQGSATLAYMREGDYFTPTATLLLKDVQAGNEAALAPAERLIADQVATVNDRINNRIEWMLWQALQGEINYTGANTGPLTVNYGLDATHKFTVAPLWNAAPSVSDLISTLRGWNQLIQKDAGVVNKEAYLTKATFDLLVEAWTDAATSDANRSLMTDAMINQYYATGEVGGFMGIEKWTTVEQYYDVRQPDGSVLVKPYIPHGTVIFGNTTENSPLKYVQGPSADFSAPSRTPGRFAKNWVTEDPSGRQFLIEESGLPVFNAPDQVAVAKVASDDWISAQTW